MIAARVSVRSTAAVQLSGIALEGFSNIGGGETWLKSAWKDTAPPARGGKRAGALTLMSMACTAVVNVMWMLLFMPKSAGSAIVTS